MNTTQIRQLNTCKNMIDKIRTKVDKVLCNNAEKLGSTMKYQEMQEEKESLDTIFYDLENLLET